MKDNKTVLLHHYSVNVAILSHLFECLLHWLVSINTVFEQILKHFFDSKYIW